MSIVNTFLNSSIILGLDSIKDSISSKTILNNILWYFTPSNNYKFCSSSMLSNWRQEFSMCSSCEWISFRLLGGWWSGVSIWAAASRVDFSFWPFCFSCSACFYWTRVSFWSRSLVYILKRVEITSVRISQIISSSFYIGPEPPGPMPAPPGLEKVPVWL